MSLLDVLKYLLTTKIQARKEKKRKNAQRRRKLYYESTNNTGRKHLVVVSLLMLLCRVKAESRWITLQMIVVAFMAISVADTSAQTSTTTSKLKTEKFASISCIKRDFVNGIRKFKFSMCHIPLHVLWLYAFLLYIHIYLYIRRFVWSAYKLF